MWKILYVYEKQWTCYILTVLKVEKQAISNVFQSPPHAIIFIYVGWWKNGMFFFKSPFIFFLSMFLVSVSGLFSPHKYHRTTYTLRHDLNPNTKNNKNYNEKKKNFILIIISLTMCQHYFHLSSYCCRQTNNCTSFSPFC